jgi:hypothetical protein
LTANRVAARLEANFVISLYSISGRAHRCGVNLLAVPVIGWLAMTVAFAGSATQEPAVYEAKPGPWGQIEYSYIYLEAPEHLLTHFTIPNTTPAWRFTSATETSLKALFTKAGLATEVQAQLLEKQQPVEKDIIIYPPLEILEALLPKSRAVIYTELARNPENAYHVNPVMIASGTVDQWLEDTGWRDELKTKFRQLCYPRGSGTAFSDLRAILGYARSDTETQDIFKTLTRTRALVARLKIEPNSDLAKIADYWGMDDRNRDSRPMLQSLMECGEPVKIDLVHLLPPLARMLLYTYPPMDLAIGGRMPDCHWTSLNFFNFSPRTYFLNTRLATSHVLENYTKVEAPYRFGDVLFFVTEKEGNAFHSCTFIADDIVYTKNGENVLSPWILTRLGDLKSTYLKDIAGRIQGYRIKPTASR